MIGPETAGVATLALGAAVATFFSPCAYALLPGYVGYYVSAVEESDGGGGGDGASPAAGRDGTATADGGAASEAPLVGALVRGLAAFAGVVAVFAALTAAVMLVGNAIEPVLGVLEPLVGVGLLALGAAVLLDYSPDVHVRLPERRSSVAGFAVFGAGYAVAGAGCVAPLFLAIVLKATTLPPAATVAVLGTYAAGFGALLVGATVAIAVGRDALLDRLSEHRGLVDTAAGVALVGAGVWQLAVVV
jgi:cytochrome c-type biogenesis protein